MGELSSEPIRVFVWLGATASNAPPRYWIARATDVGHLCVAHQCHGTHNRERRFHVDARQRLPAEWENRWDLFEEYRWKGGP